MFLEFDEIHVRIWCILLLLTVGVNVVKIIVVCQVFIVIHIALNRDTGLLVRVKILQLMNLIQGWADPSNVTLNKVRCAKGLNSVFFSAQKREK